MAATEKAKLGTGLSIAFSSGFFAEITDCNLPAMKRDEMDTTHMKSENARSYKPVDLYDPGEMTVTMHFDPAQTIPINAARETITITFRDGETWTFSGFMKGYTPRAPLEGKMTAEAVIRASGVIEVSPASS